MIKIKSIYLFLFSFIFLLFSCKNEDDIVSPTQQKLLSKIIQDADNYSTFDYEGGRLSKYEYYSNGELNISINLSYDVSNRSLSELWKDHNQEILKKYFYNKSLILDSMALSIKDISNNFKLFSYTNYFYNQSNQLSKTVVFLTIDSTLMSTEYFYDVFGNINERRYYLDNQLNAIVSYTFDCKINPFYTLKSSFNYDISMNKNNILSNSEIFVNNSQSNTQMIYNYVYDSDGYPISSVENYITNIDTTTFNQTFEYK